MGLLAIQKGSAFAANHFPGDRLYATAFDLFKAASDLFLPREFGIGVDRRIEAVDKAGRQFRPLFVGER